MKKTLLSLSVIGSLMAGAAFAQDAEAFRDGFIAGNITWEDVQSRAKEEGQVNLYYWGGSDKINVWMDSIAVPALAAEGVTLNPVRITGTKDAVDLVLAEKGSGKGLGEGSVDAI